MSLNNFKEYVTVCCDLSVIYEMGCTEIFGQKRNKHYCQTFK